MKRYRIVFTGQVTGVGFRFTLMMIARELQLTGYVRNLSRDHVEAEVQGERVHLFIKEALKRQGFAQIEDYAVKEIEPVEEETAFTVRYSDGSGRLR